MTDEELIKAILEGDESVFEELVSRHKIYVMKMLYAFARNSQEIDEMAQDVFIKAYFSLGTYRFEAPFQHWLSRITTRVALDFFRKKRRRKESTFSEIAEDSTERLEYVIHQASESSVKDPIIQRDLESLLDWAMEKLSPKDQWIVRAVELEGRTINEVSAMTGWGKSFIKVRLFRARKKMREMLEKIVQPHEVFYEK